MPAPAFSVVRGLKDAVQQPLVCVGALVGEKGIDLFNRRRKAEQVETQPADQGHAIRFRRRCDPFFFQTGEDKSIDFVADPLWIVDFGKRGAHRWQERPVCLRASPVLGQLGFRNFRSLVDPGFDARDLFFLERGLLEGHPDSPFGPGDRPDQFAFGAAARNDDGTTHTPFEDRGARVEPQPGHLDLGSMAPVTVTGKDRLYIPEVVDGLIRVDRPHRAKEERDHADPMLHG